MIRDIAGLPPAPAPQPDSEKSLETAMRLGMTLVRDAVWHDGRCNWFGGWMDYVEGALALATRTCGPDLYGGTSGIAFFLAALHTVVPDRLLRRTVEGALAQVLSAANHVGRHGFFSGTPGIAHAMIRCGERLDREDWIEAGLALLEATPPATEREIDVISGVAGTIPVLLRASATHGRPALRERAVQLGDFLCLNAHRSDAGWSWSSVPAERDTTGYSHGAAGPATALWELFAVTDEGRFGAAAERGYAYEQFYFDPVCGNWPDFREGVPVASPGARAFSMSWCHGAPGIALSRLRAARLTGRTDFDAQTEAGLKTTAGDLRTRLEQGLRNSNFSLCHGLAGNADILLEAGDTESVTLAQAVGAAGVEYYGTPRLPWPSGLPNGDPTPGLMMGAAGTGYFYLRLFDRSRFSSILIPGSG